MDNYIKRKNTKEVLIGDVKIGGNNKIAIQSMCNTNTENVKQTVAQINALEKEGCEIVRVAILDEDAALALQEIKKDINIPLVADIHFDYKLAIKAIENGADKIRINPGNIGAEDRVKAVIKKAKEKDIPIRIGVNSGSLEKEIFRKYGKITPDALVESALKNIDILKKYDYENIVVSIKSSNVSFCIKAYSILSEEIDYPLHVGITEAGTIYSGIIKSSVGLGAILAKGIGDTIRVSLTGDPLEEIKAAKQILKALNIRQFGVDFVSCPTCGRTEIDLIKIANEIYSYCEKIDKNIKVAVMGCAVNGPGEAKDADIGIACGKGYGLIFKKGKIFKKLPKDLIVQEFLKLIEEI